MARRFLSCGALVVGTVAAALAQDVTGGIAGTVLDPAAAAVPHARITVRSTDRNEVACVALTDAQGSYAATLIPPGHYSITVEAAGFKAETVDAIAVTPGRELKLDIKLQVGSRTESVAVSDASTALELLPAPADTLSGSLIRQMSLATRNYQEMLALLPGVTSDQVDQLYMGISNPSGSAAATPYSVNGQRSTAANFTVDGADNVDRGGNSSLVSYPSVDSISEFVVQAGRYSADSGRTAGAQVNVVSRGGLRQYHGSIFEYARNNFFEANSYMNNAYGIATPEVRWNDFGGTFGGPLALPFGRHRALSRTFFSYSTEISRVINYRSFAPVVPTTGELHGKFTVPVCIAFSPSFACTQTGTSIANINSVAQAYINDIWSKLPLSATSTSIQALERVRYNHNQHSGRIDQSLGQKLTLWGRILDDALPTSEPGGLFTGSQIPGAANTETSSRSLTAALHGVYQLRSNMLDEIGYNITRGSIDSVPLGLTARANSPDVHMSLPFSSVLGVVPALTFTGGSTLSGFGPYLAYNHNYNLFDNFTVIRRKHTLKFGVAANRYRRADNISGNNYGTFAFTNNGQPASGSNSYAQSWANFLLGNVATFTQNATDIITPNLRVWQVEAFAKDDYRILPRLTLDFGVRWSFFGQPVDTNQHLVNFDPAAYLAAYAPKINASTGLLVPNTGVANNAIIVAGQSSPFGDHITNNNYRDFAPRLGLAWDPFGKGRTVIRTGYGVFFDATLFGSYEQNIFSDPPSSQSISVSNSTFANPGGGTVAASLSPLLLHAIQIPSRTPYTQHWSFDLQQVLSPSLVVQAGYFGSKSSHLLGLVDINEAAPGAALAAGIKTGNGTIFTATSDALINAVRPYLGYGPISAVESAFDSNYHSLQARLLENLATKGTVSLAYTWSKNLTDNVSDRYDPPQNSANWHQGEYGPALLDRGQVLTASYAYLLPFFRAAHGPLGALLKNWQIIGVTSYGTGLPYTVATANVDPAGLGLLTGSPAAPRPDEICNANLNAPHQLRAWVNKSCFADVPQGQVRTGNAGRGTIRGPGYEKWDITLAKSFYVHERYQTQLRLESFNTFNHGNPGNFGSLNITSSQFAQITSFRDPRIVQLAARVMF
jgi:outer membrane receptor protein involved in Fe transport